jgi:hypothetical protein
VPVPELRARWFEHREMLLAHFIAANPGHRCAAWWKFESPECRRQVAGASVRPPYAAMMQAFEFGLPQYYDDAAGALFESEPAFLRRHKLLDPVEQAKLTPQDFEPVKLDEPEAA